MKDVLKEPFEELMRIMLRAGEVPDIFDHDIKKPFVKQGKKGVEAKELRPITLLCELLKIFEGWVHMLWCEHFEGSEEQAGFKKAYSCTGRLFVLQTIILYNLWVVHSDVYAVPVDPSSFFESLRHDHMGEKTGAT